MFDLQKYLIVDAGFLMFDLQKHLNLILSIISLLKMWVISPFYNTAVLIAI